MKATFNIHKNDGSLLFLVKLTRKVRLVRLFEISENAGKMQWKE
jgi:hypothetical protein